MFKKTEITLSDMSGLESKRVTTYYFLGFIPIYKSTININ